MVHKQRADLLAQCAALDKRIDTGRPAAERLPGEISASLERRAAQLAQIAAKIGTSARIQSLGQGEKMGLGIFFREERAIIHQFERWMLPAARGARETRLDKLIPRLTALHRNLLANSQTAELLLAQELSEIGRYAAKRP